MSFGCTGWALCFSAAEVNAMAGSSLSSMLFVKAAGNDNVNLKNEPISVSASVAQTALSRLILVGSVNAAGGISSFSNRPGENCLLASGQTSCNSTNQWKYHFLVAPGESIYSTLPGGRYGYMSGTSMATPVVAGAAALLEARWPTLKTNPAGVASILFNSANDIGAPGVDGVYGWGLLNVGAAFQAQGQTSVQGGASTQSLSVNGGSFTTGSGPLGKTAAILGGVTAWDAYGRDYRLDQVSSFKLSRSLLGVWATPGARLANLGRQDAWTQTFFAPPSQPRTWAAFGPSGAVVTDGVGFDRSLRVGMDMPVDGGDVAFRLTGASAARSDFASDDALRPLSFFASSELLNESALVSFARPVGDNSRLVLFGATSAGARFLPQTDEVFAHRTAFADLAADHALRIERSPREQAGFGLGYWTQPDARTVVGVTASAFVQRHAFYDLASSLDAFNAPAKVFNLGVAASRAYGDWDVYGAAEVTSLKAPSNLGPIRFTDAVLASGEIGARRFNLFFNGREKTDALSLSLAAAPTALSGALDLNYLAPTADREGRELVSRQVGLSEITGRTLRLESAYTVHAADRWSFGVSTGVDLDRDGDYLVMGQLRSRF